MVKMRCLLPCAWCILQGGVWFGCEPLSGPFECYLDLELGEGEMDVMQEGRGDIKGGRGSKSLGLQEPRGRDEAEGDSDQE